MTLRLQADQLKDETARLARFLVAHLFILLKTSLHYPEEHSALDGPVGKVLKVLADIRQRNVELTLSLHLGTLYLGGVRLGPEAAAFEAYRFVTEQMKDHQLGAIHFGFTLSAAELRDFAGLFRESEVDPSVDRYSSFLEGMRRRGIVNIDVDLLPAEGHPLCIDREKAREGKKSEAAVLYAKALTAVEDVTAAARAGQPVRLTEAKRIVQSMIDVIARSSSGLLGLTAVHRHDATSQNHAVNVCVLSLALGRKAGMSKLHLCELGMAALFHNIGKADFPVQVAERGAELDAVTREALHYHPMHGVKKMMKHTSLDLMRSRMVSGIFEHHLLADFSGFPRFPYHRLGLNGRIISIADRYDVLTCSSTVLRPPLPPDKALRSMLAESGKAYDPALLKLLVVTLGMHGIGSLLLLASGELAVVVESNPDPDRWDAPRVKIIADRSGQEIEGEDLELSDADPSRAIVTILDPHPYNLDISQYFARG